MVITLKGMFEGWTKKAVLVSLYPVVIFDSFLYTESNSSQCIPISV